MIIDFASLAGAALSNLLVVLGVAMLLTWTALALRRVRPWIYQLGIAAAFVAMTAASMTMSYRIAPGIIGDFRHAIIAIAALVGGPWSAVAATVTAIIIRAMVGGAYGPAVAGIVACAVLSIAFAQSSVPKSPLNLARFGLFVALANVAMSLLGAIVLDSLTPTFLQAMGVILLFSAVAYPLAVACVGGMLMRENQRADEEAELRRANAELTVESARTRGVFERSDVAMAWCDLRTGRFILANPQYARFTGYSEKEIVGMRFEALSADEEKEEDRAMLRPLQTGAISSKTDERRYRRKDGEIVWGLRSVTVNNRDEHSRYAMAMVQDITERKRAREEVEYLATHDSLTGLANRAVFQARLAEALESRRPDEVIGVLYIDLDDFKLINDTRGHPAGDAVLKEVAARIRLCIEPGDVAARFGGDEFGVLCRRRGADGADSVHRLAERIREIAVGDKSILPTAVSVGLALGPRDATGAEELIKCADMALYSVKAAGGDKVRLFEPEMERRQHDRLLLKADLAGALANNQLQVVYQPLVDLRSGEVVSFEALLRWNHPVRGAIAPVDFIPLAEESGLIRPIGDWVLSQACCALATWPSHISVCVNTSPLQYDTRVFPLTVARTLSEAGVEPHRLELEVTESMLLHVSDTVRGALAELHTLGVSIALDDFGTGYASLAYLQKHPFRRIKIDQSFVQGVDDNRESAAVIEAVVGLAHSLGISVTAEGIETAEQLAFVRAKGCDWGQGYLFSRPLPLEACVALLGRRLPDVPRLRIA